MLKRLIRKIAGTDELFCRITALEEGLEQAEETIARLEVTRLRAEWQGFLVDQAGLSDKLTVQLKRLGARLGRQVAEGAQTWQGDNDDPTQEQLEGLGDDASVRLADWNREKMR